MSPRSEEGIALIAVLWALTLLSLVAAALIVETRSSTHVAHNMADNAASRAAADAGIKRAILDLIAPEADKRFRANGTVYDWRFADSDVLISLRDESDKLNLNRAPVALLAAFFGSLGVDPGKAQSLADAIADFRDADDLKHVQGAEEAEYQAAGLAWGPKNAEFQSVEELQQVLGMTPPVYDRVAPDLTIYSVGAPINPTVAGERLTAILRQSGVKYPIVFPRLVYSIRAVARSRTGGAFVREAVVGLARPDTPLVLSSRQETPKESYSY